MNDHRHCWHSVYAGMGLWVTVCCHCGAWWIPEDYDLEPPAQHGQYENRVGEDTRRLSDDEVLTIFGVAPLPPLPPLPLLDDRGADT